jgi:Arf-GAP/coiled-coil/ANK repeat/PH domain-containing protein
MGDGLRQVLTYAQQSRERANYEQAALADRMQEYRQEVERESQRSIDFDTSSAGDSVGRSSHKMIEVVMQSTPKGQVHLKFVQRNFMTNLSMHVFRASVFSAVLGEHHESFFGGVLQVQTLKQGYLLKRSTNLRGDWKRRFFVLDSRGMLYYYRKQWGKATVS